MAEAVRFELTDLLQSAVFKTAGLNHSPTLPIINLVKINQFYSRLILFIGIEPCGEPSMFL